MKRKGPLLRELVSASMDERKLVRLFKRQPNVRSDSNGGTYGTSPLTNLSADWHTYGLYWRDDRSGPYGSMQLYLDGSPWWSPYTLRSSSTNMASGIYMFLLLDNDQKGGSSTNPFGSHHYSLHYKLCRARFFNSAAKAHYRKRNASRNDRPEPDGRLQLRINGDAGF
jgi:hypothetical protein